ncbi:hypothetical protein SDC9_175416 [bioreactor metagenome]|uniref:Uncharacterized protein n=1 Tax=bioreactor metagenome TaxID=1076179 RepID=A0A645GPX4_9ZZZZ
MLRRRFAQDGPGIVEEDVDLRMLRLDLRDPAAKRRPVGEIALVRVEIPAESADFAFRFATRLQRGGDSDDVRSGFRQSDGDPPADAARTAADDRQLAIEFELIENHLSIPSPFPQRISTFIASGVCARYSNAF